MIVIGEFPDLSELKAQILGHYGELDESIPMKSLDALRETVERQSGITADLRLYPANHAFFNDGRPVYDADSATRAWASTVPFLHAQLG